MPSIVRHIETKMDKKNDKKYDIRIQLQEPTLRGRKPTSLTKKEEQWIVSIYLVLRGVLQKKYCSFHKALAGPFSFLFHTKEMIDSFPKTFIISNVTKGKDFFPLFLFSFSYKRNNWEFPKNLHNFKFYRKKDFPLFHSKRDVLPLM